jgi:hypothetical protein
MKTPIPGLRAVSRLFLLISSLMPALAVVIDTDTSIGALDLTYDGQDVVVSNCTVTPALDPIVFVPSKRTYASLNTDVSNANFLTVASVTPVLSSELSGTNLVFTWPGIPGVAYWPYWSTNLSDWLPIGGWIQGSNGMIQLVIPANDLPQKFVRVQVAN